MLTLADMDGQETFDASTLGTASEVKIYLQFLSMSAETPSSGASLHCCSFNLLQPSSFSAMTPR